MATFDDERPETIGWDDFAKVDIRVGQIVRTEVFAKARKPALKLWVDFGPELGERKTSAQVTTRYTPESLIGRRVLAVINFPPRQIADFMSEVLVLGVDGGKGEAGASDIILLRPDSDDAPLGSRMH